MAKGWQLSCCCCCLQVHVQLGSCTSGLDLDVTLLSDPSPAAPVCRSVAQDRVFDISFNAFSGKFPVYVFKYLPDVTERCGCVVAVNISGPNMRLECPTDQNATYKASTLANSKLECVAADGQLKDFANYLVTGQLNAAGGSRGPNAGVIAGAVIGALLGLALLATAGYFGYKRYAEHRKAQGFVSMKDEMAAEGVVENPLEQQTPQV